MDQDPQTQPSNWIEASGLLHIFRTLRLSIQPGKIGIAFLAIFATFVVGGLMDLVWKVSGQRVRADAIDQFVLAREHDGAYQEAKGDFGIFYVWREHERRSVLGLLGSSLPGASVAAGTPVGAYVETHSQAQPLRNLARMFYGVWWLVRHHTLYAILFFGACLIIWSIAGGAICRLAAVQFARDEKFTATQALRFAYAKLWDGFVLAPCIPLGFVAFFLILLVVFGMFLRIPWVGDVLAGPLFLIALVLGASASAVLLGLFFGGSLLWPSVAVEGSDAFDAFQRSLSYASKAWKAIYYGVLATVYASLCFVVVNLGTFLALRITRAAVSYGTTWFGWLPRETEPAHLSKLQLLWPLAGPNALHAWPDWSRLNWAEHFSAVCVWFWVILVIGLMWAFLASFYFSASTIIYFLLRRDVDYTELDEVYLDDDDDRPLSSIGTTAQPAGESGARS